MEQALGRGHGTRGKPVEVGSSIVRITAAPVPRTQTTRRHSVDENEEGPPARPVENQQISARPGRFERPTTGSVDRPKTPKTRKIGPLAGRSAAPVPQTVPIPTTQPRTKRASESTSQPRREVPTGTPLWQKVVAANRAKRKRTPDAYEVIAGEDDLV